MRSIGMALTFVYHVVDTVVLLPFILLALILSAGATRR
jgi:hypothetical protein